MKEVFIETRRLIISPLTESNYENITKLYASLKDAGIANDVFGIITETEVEMGLKFSALAETRFNLMAKFKDRNEFVGYLSGYMLERRGLWFYTLAIAAGMRRNGYGTEIVNAVIEYMRISYNIGFIGLSVMDTNKTAKLFWEAMGFKIDKTMMKSGFVKDKLSKINIYVKLF